MRRGHGSHGERAKERAKEGAKVGAKVGAKEGAKKMGWGGEGSTCRRQIEVNGAGEQASRRAGEQAAAPPRSPLAPYPHEAVPFNKVDHPPLHALEAPNLETRIGHNIGSQAPISIRQARSTAWYGMAHGAQGWHGGWYGGWYGGCTVGGTVDSAGGTVGGPCHAARAAVMQSLQNP